MRLRNIIIKTAATFFYLGHLPFIPGTYASVAGVFLFYLLKGNIFLHISVTGALMILGFLVSGRAEVLFNKKDAKYIVIDEVSGMLLALLFIPYDIKLVIIAFILFRILDALKPYPSNALQNLKGSAGIMSDDIIAGVYTNIILQVVLRMASFKAS
ncbi:MAG: phosphatidylglycerophosphatase A [Candidatus Omnitrophica bacterium]|nr:phosphatidylglycerophosphatase A [Candidatus Omnitrophota bacterium]MDD5592334.1 phosphatidylglycerophosphatase A [Candidatus Omnitrophota bacterium]